MLLSFKERRRSFHKLKLTTVSVIVTLRGEGTMTLTVVNFNL